MFDQIKKQDPALYDMIVSECKRQRDGIELIPSENYVSQAILEAQGSILTNKYSEGYPKKRYYGGQDNIDDIEQLAIDRAKELFGCEHVNVQPYSGSPANAAIYFALLEFGDKVMGLKLDHGGHITHGLPISFSGKAYDWIPYLVGEDGVIDMDEVERIAMETRPKMIVAGFSAYPRNLDWKRFAEICEKVGAISFADVSHVGGLIAAGVVDSPVPYFDVVMTTTHKTLRGPRSAIIMSKEKHAKAINRAIFPGMQGGPHDHTTAAKAICFEEALRPEFKEYGAQVIKNAKVLADKFNEYGYDLVSGGTDNHLLLCDLTNKGMTGQQAQVALDRAEMTLNKNTVPYEKRSPMDPSGIRFGSPAVTTRGFKEKEMEQVGDWMHQVLSNLDDEDLHHRIAGEVAELCQDFPVDGTLI
ncbi:MAG: serine hydroxymethyltransferase [Candidatus Gracilibacteria bacterium]|nr:serine hydroxymethyltransferase [Candidatus Gracilibacteria bacterium]